VTAHRKVIVGPLMTRGSRREVPLSPGLARTLWALRPPSGEGPVFATRRGTRYLDRNLRRVLGAAADRAGLDGVGFHTFRHTCASLLLDGGKNIAQVAAWLGHSDPAFTLRTYVHLMDSGLGSADFLDAATCASGDGASDRALDDLGDGAGLPDAAEIGVGVDAA
jgi:integrase